MLQRNPRGMTLVELLVAMAILTGMIAGVGFVFTQTSRAVGAAQGRIAVNASLRAAVAVLRDDIRSITSDGVLILAAPVDGVECLLQPMMLMTVNGRFVSQTEVDPTTGEPVTANAAVIVYTLAADAADSVQTPSILCRYVFLLAGDGRSPMDLADLAAAARAADESDPNPFDATDVLGDSLADLRVMSTIDSHTNPRSIEEDYLRPLATNLGRLNTSPARMDDARSGGVVQLWPYLMGGCFGMEAAFCDGFAADGTTPMTGPTPWFTLDSDGAKNRFHADGRRRRRTGFNALWVIWRGGEADLWLRGLRLSLRLGDVGGRVEARPVEIMVPVRR